MKDKRKFKVGELVELTCLIPPNLISGTYRVVEGGKLPVKIENVDDSKRSGYCHYDFALEKLK